MKESFKTISIKHIPEADLIVKGNVIGKGGMGLVEQVIVNKNSSEYKAFLAEVAAWAEVRGDFRDVEMRFSTIRKEIHHKKLQLDKIIKTEKGIKVQKSREDLSDSVKILRSEQKKYVDERIAHLADMSIDELEHWLVTLNKPLPHNMTFALKSSFTENSAILERLKEEFMILNMLQHENIIKVYLNGDGSYLMELLDGYKGADKYIKKCQNADEIKERVKYIIEACKAVENMHEYGIIHRDIKPENIMIKNGIVKFIDLGIARSEESTNVTMDGTVMGTANYMSLNQVLGKQPNVNFDIYALAATLYSLVAGVEPYQVIYNKKTKQTLSSNEKLANIELLMMAKDSDVLPLAGNSINNIISNSLNDMIEHGMEKHNEKYNTVYDLRKDLELFVNNQPYTLKSIPPQKSKKGLCGIIAGLMLLIFATCAVLLLNFFNNKYNEFAQTANDFAQIADDIEMNSAQIVDNIEVDSAQVAIEPEIIAQVAKSGIDIDSLILLKSKAEIKFKKIKDLQSDYNLEEKYDLIELLLTTTNNFFNMKRYENLSDKYEKVIKDSTELILLNKLITSALNKKQEAIDAQKKADIINSAEYAKKYYEIAFSSFKIGNAYLKQNEFAKSIVSLEAAIANYAKCLSFVDNYKNSIMMRERCAEKIKGANISELQKYKSEDFNKIKDLMNEFEGFVQNENWEEATINYDKSNKLLDIVIQEIKKIKNAEARTKILKDMTFYPSNQVNHIMDFDGKGSYLELPVSKLKNLKEVTVEGWVKWKDFGNYSRFFEFGKTPGFNFNVCNRKRTNFAHVRFGKNCENFKGALKKNKWFHCAITIDKTHSYFYLNGRQKYKIRTNINFTDARPFHAFIGYDLYKREDSLYGQIENFRVWTKTLSGTEINILKDQNIKTAPNLLFNLSFEEKFQCRKSGNPRIIKDPFKWGGAGKTKEPIKEDLKIEEKKENTGAYFNKVDNAQFANISNLAEGSQEALNNQRKVIEELHLPLEIETMKSDIAFRLVPNGSFLMGIPSSVKDKQKDIAQHKVKLTKPFYVGKYEITQGQYEKIMQENPSRFKETGSDAPVNNVSYFDSIKFLDKLCEYENLPKGTFRLLTEAEWEFACRAGTKSVTYFGDKTDRKQIVFRGDLSKNEVNKKGSIESVGSYPPNAYGLYDMHGNVYEWCDDIQKDYLHYEVDPHGGKEGIKRSSRGGSWFSEYKWICSGARDTNKATFRSSIQGIRIAINPLSKVYINGSITRNIKTDEEEYQPNKIIEVNKKSKKQASFNFQWHNNLRNQFASSDMRKSMEQCDIIFANSIMDEYTLKILSDWELGKDNEKAAVSLKSKMKLYPDLKYFNAAILIKLGDISDNKVEAKEYYDIVKATISPDLKEYRDLASKKLNK